MNMHLLEQGGWEQPQDGLRYRTFVFNIYGTYVDASLGHFRTKLDFKSLIMETILFSSEQFFQIIAKLAAKTTKEQLGSWDQVLQFVFYAKIQKLLFLIF